MTVRMAEGDVIELSGNCPLEDAEKLQQYLLAQPAARVDWRACTSVHAAVLQMLLAARPQLLGPPTGGFLRSYCSLTNNLPGDGALATGAVE